MASRVNTFLHAIIAAFQFLSRLPMPVTVPFEEATLARSTVAYPAVGFVIGLIVAAVCAAAGWLLPTLPAAVIALVIWVALTGGLHLDGLMDTADGMLSHRSRERMLEIMKDSRVGAMGVIAGCLLLLMKVALLEVWTGGVSSSLWLLLPAAPILSRSFMAAALAGWPYARAEGGGGLGTLYRGVTCGHGWAAALLAMLMTLALTMAAFGLARWPIAFAAAAALVCITYAGGWVLAELISRKLGGLTGDTYGALNELLETLLLLVMAIGIHKGILY